MIGRREVCPDMFSPARKKIKTEQSYDDVIEHKCVFIRVNYTSDPELPKSKLIAYSNELKTNKPKYETLCEDKLFRSIVTFQGKRYSSNYW